MKTLLYRVDCLTNMHVGSGDVNYSIIDKEVEKDPVLKNVAVIHPSGIKGALKEHFESVGVSAAVINHIFGNEVRDNDSRERKTVAGSYKFMGAMLMARPLRVSKGQVSYVLTTSDELIRHQIKLFNALNIKSINGNSIESFSIMPGKEDILVSNIGEVESVEGKEAKAFSALSKNNDFMAQKAVLETLIGPSFAIAGADFLGAQDYPFMARNHLNENGISQNLWYEEVVPHESIFYFIVMADDKYLDEFKSVMEENVIQFGGNASIGYGFAKVRCVAESPEVK